MAFSRFDGPIPGQSLTTTPKNAKWEKPPQFTNKDKALEYLFTKMTNTSVSSRMVVMLENKTPVESLVRTFLFAGFTEGLWNYDLMVLLAKPVAAMIATIFHSVTGKRPPATTFKDGKADESLAASMKATKNLSPDPIPSPNKNEINSQLKRVGILSQYIGKK